mmetsp:Transcript_14680/g.22444  ORF Transcript_14680/g.22444 Transcript_14680/m.22444 type:complete len:88 (+) Transcript_14680:134-397(+)
MTGRIKCCLGLELGGGGIFDQMEVVWRLWRLAGRVILAEGRKRWWMLWVGQVLSVDQLGKEIMLVNKRLPRRLGLLVSSSSSPFSFL